MIAVWALVAFIATIVAWNALLKRNIGESMIAGFVVVGIFAVIADGFHEAWTSISEGVLDAMQEEVTFAGLAFVFMSFLLIKTPVLDKLIDVLNSVLGRLRGGPIYTSTVAAGIFGSIAHVGAAVTAAVGTVTVPWMKRTGVKPEIAATVVAGCAGMGVTFPFSATMFILVGGLAAIGAMQPDEIVLPLALAGLWCLGYRIALCFYLVRKYKIQAIDAEHRMPLKTSLSRGWQALLLFIPIAIPLLLTTGWIATQVGNYSGVGEKLKPAVKLADGTKLDQVPYAMSDVISLITWIPVLMILLVLFLGRKSLPRTRQELVVHAGQGRPRVRRHRHHHRRRVLRVQRAGRPRPGRPTVHRAEQPAGTRLDHGHRHRPHRRRDRHPAHRQRHHGRRRTGRRPGPGRGRGADPDRRRRRADLRLHRRCLPTLGRPDLRGQRHRPGRPGEDVHPAAEVLLHPHPRRGVLSPSDSFPSNPPDPVHTAENGSSHDRIHREQDATRDTTAPPPA